MATLLDAPVYVEEKVDGSQFSFGVSEAGVLRARSKNVQLDLAGEVDGMFAQAVATVRSLAALLHPGWTYRGEYLQKPRHNGLAYDRVPTQNIILFDIAVGQEDYLSPAEKAAEAARLGLECVPVLFAGVLDTAEVVGLLARTSILGGQLIEGVVVKPVSTVFGLDKKPLLAKYVSPAFKEVQKKTWRTDNPQQGDVMAQLADEYATPPRWRKAVQHLRDDGRLEGSTRDIGLVLKEVQADVLRECEEDIRDALYAWALPHLRRSLVRGLAEWYKAELAGINDDRPAPPHADSVAGPATVSESPPVA